MIQHCHVVTIEHRQPINESERSHCQQTANGIASETRKPDSLEMDGAESFMKNVVITDGGLLLSILLESDFR